MFLQFIYTNTSFITTVICFNNYLCFKKLVFCTCHLTSWKSVAESARVFGKMNSKWHEPEFIRGFITHKP